MKYFQRKTVVYRLRCRVITYDECFLIPSPLSRLNTQFSHLPRAYLMEKFTSILILYSFTSINITKFLATLFSGPETSKNPQHYYLVNSQMSGRPSPCRIFIDTELALSQNSLCRDTGVRVYARLFAVLERIPEDWERIGDESRLVFLTRVQPQ